MQLNIILNRPKKKSRKQGGLWRFFLLYAAAIFCFGQIHPLCAQIDDAEVLVEKERRVILPPARRSFEPMKVREVERKNLPQKYRHRLISHEPKPILVDFPASPARPMINLPARRFYLAAGLGTYLSPYLKAFAGTGTNKRWRAGVGLYHYSSVFGPVHGRNSGNGKSRAEAFADYFSKAGTFGANIGYERRSAHFYGYADTLADRRNFEPKTVRQKIKQSFNTIFGGISHNFLGDGRFNIQSQANFYHLANRYEAREQMLQLKTNPEFTLNSQMRIGLPAEIYVSTYTDVRVTNRNLLKITPTFYWDKEKIRLEVGVRAAYNADSTQVRKRFYFYPHLSVICRFIPKKFSAQLRATGDLKQQSLRNFTTKNAFVKDSLPLAHTDELLNAALHFNIIPLPELRIKVGGSYNLQKNRWFFVNYKEDVTRFDLLYAPKTTGQMQVFLKAKMQWKNFSASVKQSYNRYNLTKNNARPWHKPAWVGAFSLAYADSKKLGVRLNFQHLHGLEALNPQTQRSIKLKTIFDLSLHTSYALRKNILIFVEGKNLLAQKYQRYHHYQVRNLMLLIGGSISL